MTHHPSLESGLSQCACIFAELERQPGEWVSLGRLHVVSGSMNVHSRISDLRKRGHVIQQRNERPKGKTAPHSFYRLVIPLPENPAP